jgi:hypothetical protein
MISSYENLNDDQWLLRHARNVHSENGEDGVIEKIFETILPTNRWCVEFGAWDGKLCSNTFRLIKEQSWSGVFIEADKTRYQELLATYKANPRAHCVNRFVSFEGQNSLDSILASTPIPKDFDFLSIDIDGNDYHIWDSVKLYQPRVVVVEFNLTIPSHVEFIQPRDMRVQQGTSPLSLVKLGRAKGYELVCLTAYNAFFVKAPLFSAFHITDNTVPRLRPNLGWEYHIFQLFDGTFVVCGPDKMHWQALPLRQEKFQVMPKMLRAFDPKSKGFFFRATRRIWAALYRRGLA